MILFTSDPHYYHRNVIKLCERPFADVREMNESLIANWNSVVGPEDSVYVLGDFAFCGVNAMRDILQRLNGKKYIVPGNHDPKPARLKNAGFEVLNTIEVFEWGDRKFTLSHYPYAPTRKERFIHKLKNFWRIWRKQKYMDLRYMDRRPPDKGGYLLHGHVHCAWRIKGRQFNVGVDVNNFRPISIDDIIAIIDAAEPT